MVFDVRRSLGVVTVVSDLVAAGDRSEPVEEFDVRRRYLEGSLVLETQFTTRSGMVKLRDSLLFGADERGHEIGLTCLMCWSG